MTPLHTRLSPDVYLTHLREESARFREVLTGCDPAARVPTCPDWSAADLLWHLATVQRWWAEVLAARPARPEEVEPPRPEAYDDLLAAYDEWSARLVEVLDGADPGEEAWCWSDDHTVGFILRRQAHEALIHRVDAELTAGTASGVDAVLAADGVHEVLDVMYGGCPAWGVVGARRGAWSGWMPPTPAPSSGCGSARSPAPTPRAGRRTATRRTSTWCRPRARTSSPTSSSTARRPRSTCGCGAAATTTRSRVAAIEATYDRFRAVVDSPID